jgi:predicted protein tyrosine phosphatase
VLVADEVEIVARSLADAKRDVRELDDDQAVVSIGARNANEPDGFDPSNPLHVRLTFDDVTVSSARLHSREMQPPEREDIEKLLDRADDLLESGYVYCHCAAGISRSTAAAFILQCLIRPPGSEREAMEAVLEDNPFAAPNRLMVKLADEILGRDGDMLSAIEAVTRQL